MTNGAVANIFNVEVIVISTLGDNATETISPVNNIPYTRFVVGYLAEGQGDHYVVPEGKNEQLSSPDDSQLSKDKEDNHVDDFHIE